MTGATGVTNQATICNIMQPASPVRGPMATIIGCLNAAGRAQTRETGMRHALARCLPAVPDES